MDLNKLFAETKPPIYVFIDLETTGLNPEIHGIIQIAAYACGATEDDLYGYFMAYAKPEPDCVINPEAMKFNSIDKMFLEKQPSLELGMLLLHEFLNDLSLQGQVFVVCHNAPFDVGFLRIAAERFKIHMPQLRRVLDTVSLGFEAENPERTLSLEALCAEHGITNRQKHDALTDAVSTAKLFYKLTAKKTPPLYTSGATWTISPITRLGGPV